jgi:hypothetical protein
MIELHSQDVLRRSITLALMLTCGLHLGALRLLTPECIIQAGPAVVPHEGADFGARSGRNKPAG